MREQICQSLSFNWLRHAENNHNKNINNKDLLFVEYFLSTRDMLSNLLALYLSQFKFIQRQRCYDYPHFKLREMGLRDVMRLDQGRSTARK